MEKDSCAFKEEESLTSSSCNDRFEGGMAVHLRWKNFKKVCFFPAISNRWGRIALYLGRDYTHLNIQKLITFSNGSARNLRENL